MSPLNVAELRSTEPDAVTTTSLASVVKVKRSAAWLMGEDRVRQAAKLINFLLVGFMFNYSLVLY